MSLSEMIEMLVSHGCPDITRMINNPESDTLPRAFGGFGDIYLGKLYNTQSQNVAIKCARFNADEDISRKALKLAARELYAWSKCKHDNVIELIGLAEFRGQLSMVSPWMSNGVLPVYLARNPDADRYQLCLQITDGLAYLHNVKMVHGDLKGCNIMVSQDGVAKLIDFGNTKLKEASLLFTTGSTSSAISLRWAAPELLGGEPQTAEADVYALGMTILEVMTGAVPFSGFTDQAVCSQVLLKNAHPARPIDHDRFKSPDSDLMWSLLTQCWDARSKARPTAAFIREKLRNIQHENRVIPASDKYISMVSPHTPASSRNALAASFSIPNQITSNIDTNKRVLIERPALPASARYQIVNVAHGGVITQSGTVVGASTAISEEEVNGLWVPKRLDNGHYQFKSASLKAYIGSNVQALEGDSISMGSIMDGTDINEWDIVCVAENQFMISHPNMLLCWGISSQAQEKVILCARSQNLSNYWSFKPLKVQQVKPDLYKIFNVFYSHVLFGSKDGSNPTAVWRIMRGAYTIDRIQNNAHGFFTYCNASPVSGGDILGSNRTATEWIIQRVSQSETQFTISPKDAPHLFWGYPSEGFTSTLHLREGAEDPKNHWEFHFAEKDTVR